MTSRRLARRSLAVVTATMALAVDAALPSVAAATSPPASLEFAVQPGSGPELAPLSRQPVVRLVDADGETATTSHLAVTLTLVGSGGSLYCDTLPLQALAGVARFSGCAVNGPGTFRLRASAYGIGAALSDPFSVGAPGPVPPAHLLFDGGDPMAGTPFTATAGGSVWFPLRFLVVDPRDRTITTGAASTTRVTIAMAPNWEGATVSCPGGLTAVAVAGVASFPDCSISEPGEGLQIVASADGFEPVSSIPIRVWEPGSPKGPNLDSLQVSTRGILWGEAVDFHVQMHPFGAGQDVVGRRVDFQATRDPYDPETWQTIGSGTTDSTGIAWFRGYTPPDNRYYRAVFTGGGDLGPAISLTGARVVVRQKIALVPATRGSTRTIARGTTVRFTAVVRPLRAGSQPGIVEWQVWHAVSGHVTVANTRTSPDAGGAATLTVRFTSGTWRIQARALPTASNANSGWSVDRYRVP